MATETVYQLTSTAVFVGLATTFVWGLTTGIVARGWLSRRQANPLVTVLFTVFVAGVLYVQGQRAPTVYAAVVGAGLVLFAGAVWQTGNRQYAPEAPPREPALPARELPALTARVEGLEDRLRRLDDVEVPSAVTWPPPAHRPAPVEDTPPAAYVADDLDDFVVPEPSLETTQEPTRETAVVPVTTERWQAHGTEFELDIPDEPEAKKKPPRLRGAREVKR